MAKREHSPTVLPRPKRLHGTHGDSARVLPESPFESLYDELILVIFSYLSYNDLCAAQHVSRNWARLALDNQLWKGLYLDEFGRSRLRGVRGFIGRSDGREMKPLPGRIQRESREDTKDWKWMFRISSNWRTGRCSIEQLHDSTEIPRSSQQSHGASILLAGSLTVTSVRATALHPELSLASPLHGTHRLSCRTPSFTPETQVTALALDQAAPADHQHVKLSVFLSTGEFIVFSINHVQPSQSLRLYTYLPTQQHTRTAPILQAAYHGRLLATLSETFHLSLYDLSGDTVKHTQTLHSFTSYPPSSLVLTPTSSSNYKLVIAYAVPVFPAHYSVGATELIISAVLSTVTVTSSRTTRAIDVPSGWIDENKLRLVREQWSRKVVRVADTQTDGKWVVLAADDAPPTDNAEGTPSTTYVAPRLHSPSSLQLYRLYLPASTSGSAAPRLSFVRTLHGQMSPITALALADGRCVSLGLNGSIWAWDLEAGTGAEVYGGSSPGDSSAVVARNVKGHVIFDERRIVSADSRGVEVRRFDI